VGTDWAVAVTPTAVTWSTDPFDVNANANALRWGTLYNFRFDANVPPGTSLVEVGYFRPGTPSSAFASSVVPEPCTGLTDGASCEEGNLCTTAISARAVCAPARARCSAPPATSATWRGRATRGRVSARIRRCRSRGRATTGIPARRRTSAGRASAAG
jgi:hypothetical protein